MAIFVTKQVPDTPQNSPVIPVTTRNNKLCTSISIISPFMLVIKIKIKPKISITNGFTE